MMGILDEPKGMMAVTQMKTIYHAPPFLSFLCCRVLGGGLWKDSSTLSLLTDKQNTTDPVSLCTQLWPRCQGLGEGMFSFFSIL